MAIKEMRLGVDPGMNRPTNTKNAICDNDSTSFIVSHMDGFSQSN